MHLLLAALPTAAVIPASLPIPVCQWRSRRPALKWTGGYIGAQIGYAWGDSEYYVMFFGATSHPDPDGLIGGVYGGFDHEFSNNVVLGIEGDFSFSNVGGEDNITTAGGVMLPFEVIDTDLNRSSAIRGRLGYAVDRFLPYFGWRGGICRL